MAFNTQPVPLGPTGRPDPYRMFGGRKSGKQYRLIQSTGQWVEENPRDAPMPQQAAGGGGAGGGSGGNLSTSMAGLRAAAGNDPFSGGGGMPQTGGGYLAPGGGGGGGTIGGVAPVGPIDTTAADEASFARAKDVAGQTGRASLESLRGLMGETGQLGGGAETQATRDIVESAAGQVGDVNREQAIQRSERGFQTALANQQSGLTQRGQDINAQEAQARLALAQTQLQFQQAQMQSQRQLDLLKLALSQANTASSALY